MGQCSLLSKKNISFSKTVNANPDIAFKASEIAYYVNEMDIKTNNNTNWEVFATSADYENTKAHGYQSVAFINDETKEIHITTAGTNPSNYKDLIDDLLVVNSMVPYKIKPAQNMLSNILKEIGTKEAKNYSFSTSGHSLGAIMSDLTAGEIISKGYKFKKSTTFENPGSRDIIEKAIENNIFSGKKEIKLFKKISKSSKIYNAKPNFINTSGKQLSKPTIIESKNPKYTKTIKEEDTSKYAFASYLQNKIGSAVKTCSDYLGVTSIIDQMMDHKIDNFDSVFENCDLFEETLPKLLINQEQDYKIFESASYCYDKFNDMLGSCYDYFGITTQDAYCAAAAAA